jgi:methyl-accepting chemotaxis protein
VLVITLRIYLYDFIKNSKNEENISLIQRATQNINNHYESSESYGYDFFDLKNSLLFHNGIIIILNGKNEILYSNLDFRVIEDNIKTDESLLLQTGKMPNIINAGYNISKDFKIKNNCHVFDFKLENKYYLGYLFNSIIFQSKPYGVKFLYLYPKENIINPIYPVIFFVLIVSLIVFLIVGFIFYRLSEIYSYPINNLEYVTKRASQGYMNFDIISESNDELGRLYKNFTQMIKFNKSILVEISNSSNNLLGYQKSLERSLTDFIEKVKNQKDIISNNAKLVDEFDETISRKIQHIKNVKGIIENTQTQSDESTELINEMIVDINNIAQTGQQINYIAELLNKISEKTRLLSVNSAIEASRAGEVGKGFGVVATEIRKLAVLAKDSAKEIAELVKINDTKIISGISKTNEVLGSLKNINSSVKMINQIIEQINVTTQEEKKNNQVIVTNEKNFVVEASSNITSLESIDKIRNLFKMDLEKIKNAIKKIIFDIREKITIRDVKLYSEIEIENKQKAKKQAKKDKFLREPESSKNLKKVRARRSSKLDSVRSITLYKPKKSILSKFIK